MKLAERKEGGEVSVTVEQTCERCRFWCRIEAEWGQCRRRAPDNRTDGRAPWAKTHKNVWCGEYSPSLAEVSKGIAEAWRP